MELTLEALRRSMRLIYQKARARSPQLGALLNSGCDIMSVDDREVLFEFKYRIHADRAAAKANLDGLRSIILELTGREMIINCLYKEDVSDWKQRETASRSALVRAAQELGARVLPPEFGPPAGKPTAAP